MTGGEGEEGVPPSPAGVPSRRHITCHTENR